MAKLVGYDFRLLWTPGKTHIIADALSRSPVFPADEELDILVCTVRAARTSNKEALLDPALARLIQTAKEDEDYQSVYEAIESFKEVHKLPDGHPGQMFKMHWNALSTEPDMPNLILYHGRIIVPEAARKEVIENLHKQHAGETKTLQLARSLYFWPGNKTGHTLLQ